MWVSEVKRKKGKDLGSFHLRKSFANMNEGLDWARNWAMQIVVNSFYKDEELIMHHYEDK